MCITSAGINQLMQIVSEAVFERLRERPLLYTSTHNRIAYLTSTQLTLRDIAIQARSNNIRIKGGEVAALSLQNPHFIVILYQSGLLQVRKVEALNELLLAVQNVLVSEKAPKVRVSTDAVYILGSHLVQKVWLSHEGKRQQIYLGQKLKEQAMDMLLSLMLQQQKVIIFQYRTFVSLAIEGIPVAKLQFSQVKSLKLLRDPLQMQTKQYLLVVDMNKWLKVFDLINLQQILEMQLFLQNDEEIQMKVDPLHEYLLLRVYDAHLQKTKRNSLLKINKDYYREQTKQPFFLFDIQLGLRQDLILFPTHLQIIQGSKFHSIDMCFFTPKQIRIATLVIDINHRTRLYHTTCSNSNWKSITHWNDILLSLKDTEPINSQQYEYKKTQLPEQYYKQGLKGKDDDWDYFVAKFIQENMQNFKTQGFIGGLDKSAENKHKCLEYSGSKKIQNQDALNTLSGSSSFKSIGSGTQQIQQKLLKMIEGQNYYSQGQYSKEKHSEYSQQKDDKEEQQNQSSESDAQGYLVDVQDSVIQIFTSVQGKIQKMNEKLARIQDVHLRKLKNIQKKIKNHRKDVDHLQQNLLQWSGERMEEFGIEIKQSLKRYSSMIGRLEVMGIRNLKKIKKGYRDFINQELQSRQQKLEQSEISCQKIEVLMKKLNCE